jgi:D-3-phosphoglycerate dehydrogenase
LTVTGSKGEVAEVSGTLAADGSPRLTQWGGYRMDAQLEGNVLVIRNEDRPGVIGALGTLLGTANINVSRMQVGLGDDRKDAASLWVLDTPIGDADLVKVRAVRDVKAVFAVRLSD